MRILVTGAGGFVGGHLLDKLVAAGHDVVAASSAAWVPPVEVATSVFDLRDAGQVRDAVSAAAPDAVIHLAAMASPRLSWEDPDQTYAVNVVGASHLFEALAPRPETRVLLVGSGQQYRLGGHSEPIRETDPLEPSSPYGLSKVAQELMGSLYWRRYGMPVMAARSFNHTGPGQSADYAIGSFCRQVASIERGDQPPEMKVGWLGSRRDFLDVRDVAEAYRLLIERGQPGEVYNVASGQAQRMGDLLDILLDATALKGVVTVTSDAAPGSGDPPLLVGDASKLRQALGWAPVIPVRTSLIDTLDGYRRQPNQRI